MPFSARMWHDCRHPLLPPSAIGLADWSDFELHRTLAEAKTQTNAQNPVVQVFAGLSAPLQPPAIQSVPFPLPQSPHPLPPPVSSSANDLAAANLAVNPDNPNPEPGTGNRDALSCVSP